MEVVERYGLFDHLFAFGQPADSSRRFKEANMKMRTGARVPGWCYDEEEFDQLLSRPNGRLSVDMGLRSECERDRARKSY